MSSDRHPLAQQLAPARLTVSVGQYSACGEHPINQDCHAARLPQDGLLDSKGIALAIADGISTSAFSHVASEIAVTGVLEDYFSTPQTWSVKKSAQRIITATNSWLYAQSRRGGLTGIRRDQGYACTLSVLILKSTTAYLLHIGDARIYRIRDGHIEQLTRDHHAYLDGDRPHLSRALGVEPSIEVDYQSLPLQADDCFLLLTDGVYTAFTDAQLMAAANTYRAAPELAQHLVNQAQVKGSKDDCTAQVLHVNSLPLPRQDELSAQPGMLPCPPLLNDGDKLDDYTIIRELHASSRSHIYLAQHTQSDARVIIKIPSLDARHDPVYLERMLMEEWLLHRIQSKHVVSAVQHANTKTALYAVCSYIDGITLTAWMQQHPHPSLEEVRHIVEQITSGLQACHRLDIVHRDLRPDNIMIDQAGTVRIIDLGSASAPGLEEWQPGQADPANGIGTLAYSAPELFLGERASVQSDQYALATITYHMLTGQLPYGTEVARARSKSAHAALVYTAAATPERDLPTWIDETLSCALHPDPQQRFEALSEFIQGLRIAPRYPHLRSAPSLMERHPLRVWQTLCLLLTIIVLWLSWLLVNT
jgi:serine/threonine protein phosphatase PrpC